MIFQIQAGFQNPDWLKLDKKFLKNFTSGYNRLLRKRNIKKTKKNAWQKPFLCLPLTKNPLLGSGPDASHEPN